MLMDHHSSVSPGSILFIHTISNSAVDIDATVAALDAVSVIRLVTVQQSLPHTTISPFHLATSTVDISSLPLCERCFHHIDEIESVFRDSVVSVQVSRWIDC